MVLKGMALITNDLSEERSDHSTKAQYLERPLTTTTDVTATAIPARLARHWRMPPRCHTMHCKTPVPPAFTRWRGHISHPHKFTCRARERAPLRRMVDAPLCSSRELSRSDYRAPPGCMHESRASSRSAYMLIWPPPSVGGSLSPSLPCTSHRSHHCSGPGSPNKEGFAARRPVCARYRPLVYMF
ncbi:hypothetical protein OH77DRAFT_1262767 [Trametes cingulata]|nr:hypothetical protein OH77DRAFT_1262767 [Trametes cingulata]